MEAESVKYKAMMEKDKGAQSGKSMWMEQLTKRGVELGLKS